MGSVVIYFFTLILGICEAIWYFTCTEHKDVPLILVLLDIAIVLCPILGTLLAIVNIFILGGLINERTIELKNNWFNRIFLAYNAE